MAMTQIFFNQVSKVNHFTDQFAFALPHPYITAKKMCLFRVYNGKEFQIAWIERMKGQFLRKMW